MWIWPRVDFGPSLAWGDRGPQKRLICLLGGRRQRTSHSERCDCHCAVSCVTTPVGATVNG